jgi:GT2 family glycosyltransferase
MLSVLIVAPVFMRTEKTVNFLSSLMGKDYSGIEISVAIAINKASPWLESYINSWEKEFEKLHRDATVFVHKNDKNIGKGKAVNSVVADVCSAKDIDFICSIDSDVVQVQYKWLKRLLEVFDVYDKECLEFKEEMPLGLVSPNIISAPGVSCNIHNIDRSSESTASLPVGNYTCISPYKNEGIAGPCFLIRKEAWDTVGGYYDALYIGGNDAYLLQDLWNKGFRALMVENQYYLHPVDSGSEKSYADWKLKMNAFARKKPDVLPEGAEDFHSENLDL